MLGQTYFDDIEEGNKIQEEVKKQKKKKSLNKKLKKEKHQNIMKNLSPSCFSCSAHSNDYLRLIPQPLANRPLCKSCGFKLSGKLGYLICPKSISCYFLCSSCKVCLNNHMLRKMFTLSHLKDDQLYEKNMFKCHGCKCQKQVDTKKGVYHCNPCAFSICSDCIERTETLWQQKNISSGEESEQQDI